MTTGSAASHIERITVNLIVDAIEPCLPFWVERLGFRVSAEVPHDGKLGFVILAHDELELMLQTRASVAGDVPPAAEGAYRSSLYLRVRDLAPIRAALAGVPQVIPERHTFYGADELIVWDPAGNVIAFAHRRG